MIEAVYAEFQKCREKEDNAKKTYHERDIRISYWNAACEVLRFLYIGLKQLDQRNYVRYHRKLLNNARLKACDLDLLKKGHFNMLNSKIIIDSWSNFELLVTLTCEKVLCEVELERIKEEVYSRIINYLPIDCRTADSIENLEYLKKENIAHSSIPRKYNALLKITKPDYYKAQQKADRKFLDFYGKLRNCIHSNFIYFGRPYIYSFDDVRFTFNNNKTVLTEPLRQETIFNIFKMLNEVVERIINNIEFDDLIDDPSHDLIQS